MYLDKYGTLSLSTPSFICPALYASKAYLEHVQFKLNSYASYSITLMPNLFLYFSPQFWKATWFYLLRKQQSMGLEKLSAGSI